VSHHTLANNTSKASRRQPVDHSNNEDADDEGEDQLENTEVNVLKQRRPRTSNSDIRSSQLRFYSGTWVDVLIAAKNNYRMFIHNEDPFPERTETSLQDARNCLIDAIGAFREERRLPLDDGKLIQS